jgi:hypothetical protein
MMEEETSVETITLDEYPDMRARIVTDPYAETPYDDGSSPVICRRYGLVRCHQVEHMTSYEVPAEILTAANRWLSYDAQLFERYMRIFHGSTEFEYFDSNDADYVTFDTEHWRKAIGIPDLAEWRTWAPDGKLANAAEFRAWLAGESYSILIEKRVWYAQVDRDLVADPDTVTDDWETVDSLSGLYGDLDGYVTDEAREMLRATASDDGRDDGA